MTEEIRKAAKKVRFVGQEARLEPYDIGQVGPDQILVKARCSLISIGTETTALTGRWNDEWFRENPGYALAGDVVAIGENVTAFQVGDRVCSEKNHCNYGICSTAPNETMKIPEGVTYEEATFIGLSAVALHAVRRSQLKIGESLLIMGAGIVGILVYEFGRRSGAYPILFSDLSKHRLDFVKELGADGVLCPGTDNLRKQTMDYTGKDGADVVVEAVGNPNVLQDGLKLCASGGRVVSLGALAGEIAHLDLFADFITRELTLIAAQQPMNPIVGNLYYPFTKLQERKYIFELMKRKDLDVSRYITHRYSYARIPEVYSTLKNGKNADYADKPHQARDMIGVLIDWEKDE